MNYLLDTNILIHSVRNIHFKQFIRQKYFKLSNSVFISIVNKAEVLSIAEKNNWGIKKLSLLHQLLNDVYVLPINNQEIVKNYINIDSFSQGRHPQSNFSARNMGKNDIWIASTTMAIKGTLVTTDLDFQHLRTLFLDIDILDFQNIIDNQ